MRTLNAMLGACAMEALREPSWRKLNEPRLVSAATAELSSAAMDLARITGQCWPTACLMTGAVHGLAHRDERRLFEARLEAEALPPSSETRLVAVIAAAATGASHARTPAEVAIAIAQVLPFRCGRSVASTEAAAAFGGTPSEADRLKPQTTIGRAAAVAVSCVDGGELDWNAVVSLLEGVPYGTVPLAGLFAGLLASEPLPPALAAAVQRRYLIAGLAAGLDRLAADRCQLMEL